MVDVPGKVKHKHTPSKSYGMGVSNKEFAKIKVAKRKLATKRNRSAEQIQRDLDRAIAYNETILMALEDKQ